MNIGRACGIFMNIDSENFTEDEKLVAIRDVLKEMVTYNGITKDNILKAFRWFFDWAVEEASADSGEWIPCGKEKPRGGENIATVKWYDGTIEVVYAYYTGFDWITGCGEKAEVIAYMPLPPAYKERNEE